MEEGYDAFFHMDMASSASKNSGPSNSHGAHPPLPQIHPQSRYVGYPPSPINAFSLKTDASPAMSDSSVTSVDAPMHEVASFSGPSAGLPSSANIFSTDVRKMPDAPPRRGAHRRAQSEIAFRLPDELLFDRELALESGEIPTLSDDAGEELVSAYLDMENTMSGDLFGPATLLMNEKSTTKPSHHSRSLSVDDVFAESDMLRPRPDVSGSHGRSGTQRPRHQHSFSMDGSTSFGQDLLMGELDCLETKKAVGAEKLAELALLDPKRAKRILANRQSAARSKERKMRYISELERKVQTLQTEATSLSTQLTVLQRDTTGLTTENSELKLRLQSMEQQAKLREALNDTLKEEVQRLKSSSVQMNAGNMHAFTGGTHPLALNQPFFQIPHFQSQQLNTQVQQAISHTNHQQNVQQSGHPEFIQRNLLG